MKNQFKKSLSLIMAVLMLMSCWVWVAPTEAEAGAPTSYDVSWSVTFSNQLSEGSSEAWARIYHSKASGGYQDINITSQVKGKDSATVTVTVTGFPTQIQCRVYGYGAGTDGTADVIEGRWQDYYVNGTLVAKDGCNFKKGGIGNGGWGDWMGPAQSSHTTTWVSPYLHGMKATLSNSNITLAAVNSGTDSTATITLSNFTDQYGVNYSGTINSNFNLYTEDGIELDSNATLSGSGNSRTITVKPWFQTLFSGKQNAKLYVGWDINNKAKFGTETITVTFPTYKATFYSNTGTIGLNGQADTDGVIEITHDKMNIGSEIGVSPDYHVKEGYDFVGYYSKQNPVAAGLTASFKGTEFIDKETTVPHTVGKDYGYDSNEDNENFRGDTKWYAAWKAKKINVTFLTADRQLIGTIEGRYNNGLLTTDMYKDIATLNTNVMNSYTAGKIKFNTTDNTPVYTDGSTTYAFSGWRIIDAYDVSLIDKVIDQDSDVTLKGDVTFQAMYTKAGSATYTVKFKNAEGNVISTKSDYKYRDDVTNIPAPANAPTKAQDDKYSYDFIGWAKDIGKNFYIVDETDRDENGATVVYTHKDAASFVVKGDASYVPVFKMVPREYNVEYQYFVDNEDTNAIEGIPASKTISGYHWLDSVKDPEIGASYTAGGRRHYLTGWKLAGKDDSTAKEDITQFIVEGENTSTNGKMTLVAVYGKVDEATYTVEFLDKDGNSVSKTENIKPGTTINVPEIADEIDTENIFYKFNCWKNIKNNNTVIGETVVVNADAVYQAVYDEKVYADLQFFNYDGSALTKVIKGYFEGDIIPTYGNEDPVKPEDMTGTYKFVGWNTAIDGTGTNVEFGTTIFTGDTNLYAQYETVYKEYTVTFLNDVLDADGKNVVVSKKKYHYGQDIEIPADPTKSKDDTYSYEFRAWSPDVSDICYDNATYTAVYDREFNFYKVTWLDDTKKVHAESNYKFNAKIQPGVIKNPVDYSAPETGKEWALDYWVQCDEKGNPVDANGNSVAEENAATFVYGQKMPAKALYFYPVFKQVENQILVKFYKDKEQTSYLGEVKIPYGRSIKEFDTDIEALAHKESDETHHFEITAWKNIENDVKVDIVSADVSVYAEYTQEAHSKGEIKIIVEPTCTEAGVADFECASPDCDYVFRNVTLDVIPDEAAPGGQLHVGENKWTLDDYKAGINYSDVKYVGPQTMVIVNAEDFGSRSKNNPDAILHRGVGKVDYYVSTEEINPSGIANWNNIYDYELIADQVLKQVLEAKGKTMQDYIAMSTPGNKDKKTIDSEVKEILATYNANATGSLSDLNLVNGSEYIIYLRISDREVDGRSNVSYLSSGKIHYGSTAATVTVSGDGFGTKFCADATIKVTDDTDGYKVYLDSIENEITLDANGEYKCEAKGVHTVTVVDKHGNITTKIFEVKGNHTNRQYVINATCENEGSRYNICTVCGAKSVEETIPALGHSFAETFTDKAPTCVVDGYRTYVCGNNCGTKLVIKPTDDAEKIAQAKKFVEAADGEEEGTWVALTAKDIEHLKATGKHTYPFVKDENGEDTTELAWIIDKAATCSVEGSKHIDCTVCGHIDARRVESIPVDTVNGHKFYREKVISEPLCQEIGKKAKTCRYCGYVETTEYIPALGHVAGEYVTLVEPTCTAVGSEMRTCSRCECYIGEGEYDPTKAPVAKEIPALGHAWTIVGEVWQATDETADAENGIVAGEWYQSYVCSNDASHTKVEWREGYEPPVPATVTFKNGDTDVKVINGYVGNVITAAQVTEKPEKAADATYNYTFKGWATKNADGTYTDVNFPIEVKGDATYYAVYTEKFVNYTITYYKEDGATEFKKTGYLHNGDKVALADGPSKAETTLVEYKFAGWVVIGSSPEVVLTEEATIAGANISLKAKYTEKTKKYAITYAYSKSDILETFEVDAGTEARDCAITPVKKADSKNHYEFKAWNKAAQLAAVESNIYTTPDFEPIGHTYTHEGGIVTKSPATCDSNRIDTYTCTCGYTFDKEIPGTKREHDWSDRIVGADGSVTKECTYEDCDAVDSKVETFTAKFFVNEADEKAIKTVSHIAWGTKIEAIQLPATPSKEANETYTYTFKGWAVKGKTDVVDVTAIEIKADYEFVAIFTPTIREYNVIFAYDAYNTIETHRGVKAGSSVTFGGAKPTKACDETKHYTFSGWIGYSGTEHNITITNIQSDLYILADFAGTKHKYTEKELSAATCTNGTGTRYWCDCNGNGEFDAKVNGAFVDHYEDKTGKPLPHNFEETKRVPATQHADGYVEYTCTVCKTVEKETLKYVDNVIDIKVTITVNGAAKSGIQVEIQPKDGVPFFATTNANGVASAEGTKGVSYTAYATIDGEKVQVTLKEDANGNITGSYNHEDKDVDCSCACHRNNVWGSIFRFFHKIIKLFTGKFKCCGNPDPMYG